MSTGKVVVARLAAHAGTATALAPRVFPNQAPQDTAYPYATYEEFDGERFPCMGSDGDLTRELVRVNLWHTDYPAGRALAAEVRLALQRFRGVAGTVTVEDIFTVEGAPTNYDDLAQAWRFQRDFEVIYRE
jgi:hypothetical protein